MMVYRHCFVSGRVQGVFFRASTREEAQRLGVAVRANNLGDGRVEVVMRGEAARVEALQRWLWEGPPMARVTAVQCSELGEDEAARLM